MTARKNPVGEPGRTAVRTKPVRVTGSGRILVRVHDSGPGPADPVAGLVPAWSRPDQREGGLWLIHTLGLDAALIRSRDGFTVRLAAGHA